MPVISAKDLNLWYGDFKALKGISLDVGEQEITALIGPPRKSVANISKGWSRMVLSAVSRSAPSSAVHAVRSFRCPIRLPH